MEWPIAVLDWVSRTQMLLVAKFNFSHPCISPSLSNLADFLRINDYLLMPELQIAILHSKLWPDPWGNDGHPSKTHFVSA
jgi:hypothetical protein